MAVAVTVDGALVEPGPGARRRMNGAKRRAQIIEVASALIAQRGFWGVSLKDIAVPCEITDAAIVHHFGSKEGLLLEVLRSRDEADRHAVERALGLDEGTLYEQVRGLDLTNFCEAMVRRNSEQPEIVRLYAVLSAEALQPSHPAHGYFLDRERRVIGTFAAARHDGNSEEFARLVLAVMDGIQLRWLRDLRGMDLVDEWSAAARRLF